MKALMDGSPCPSRIVPPPQEGGGYGILQGKEVTKQKMLGVVDDFNVESRRVIVEPCPRWFGYFLVQYTFHL